MFVARRITALLFLLGALFPLSACKDQAPAAGNFQWLPLYGDFTTDRSAVVARVGDLELTENMVKLYIDELPPRLKSNYQGPDGERLALRRMVDQVLLVKGAVDLKLYNDPDVARQLVSQRRNTLEYAMRNYGLLRGKTPSKEEMRKYFDDNKANYRQQALAMSRHIECLNRGDANRAYQRLKSGKFENNFAHVLAEASINPETKKQDGNTGWFAAGGFIPYIMGSETYSTKAHELGLGLHPPVQIGERWHVIEVTQMEYERPQTFGEAKDKLLKDMLPAWQDALVRDYLATNRAAQGVELLGKFAPGQGASAEELFARARNVADPASQLELLELIHTDYAQSDRADDALFMAASIAIETWQDRRVAERYLTQLLKEYPASELAADATFLRDNLYNPKVMNPQSIEDLKQN